MPTCYNGGICAQTDKDNIKMEIGKIKATRHLNLASIDIYVLLECATS